MAIEKESSLTLIQDRLGSLIFHSYYGMAVHKDAGLIVEPRIYRVSFIFRFVLMLLGICQVANARQIERAAAEDQVILLPEEDAHMQLLNNYLRHKIALNTADEQTLKTLGILTPVQLNNFIQYRNAFGKLLSIYELQAIPGFDTAVINELLPYVQLEESDQQSKGDHTILLRYSRDLERSRGYLTGHYLGSADKVYLRYRYSLPNYISYGFLTEKDAGEERLTDFFSAHLFVRNYKHIKALALGDFTINMGQGLVNWQAMTTGKGAAVMNVKRESELLKPYASAGEFYFFRGVGITMKKNNWESTGFVSLRKPDRTTDSLTGSLVTTGYHRSYTELEKTNTQQQFTAGGNIAFVEQSWQVGFNIIHHHFSKPLQKDAKPYNLFAFSRTRLTNASIDYSLTWRNFHFFGEAAMSDNYKMGLLHGVLISVTKYADLALLYRNYDRAYQFMYPSAFGEYYKPVNERGWYTAVSFKLSRYLMVNGFADVFSFPWLQYRMNAPGGGRELLLALTYTPDKHTEVFFRYNDTGKWQKEGWLSRRSWRCQLSFQPVERVTIKTRAEVTTVNDEKGSLMFADVGYKFLNYQLFARYTKFMTEGTATTMYVLGTGVLYEYVLSHLYGKGYQYQFRARWRVMPKLSLWARFEQEVYPGVSYIGSSWDKINGHKKTSIVLQLQRIL
jgi:hypothetical protein